MVGILSRENLATTLALNGGFSGRTLQILVENQGRINYNVANDFKGIIGDVLVNSAALTNWTISGFPLDDVNQIQGLINESSGNEINENAARMTKFTSNIMQNGPIIFHASFDIEKDEIHDTYVNTTGWGKVGITMFNSVFWFHLNLLSNLGNLVHQRI